MRRFQFFDQKKLNQPINHINLQIWYVKTLNSIFSFIIEWFKLRSQQHFQILVNSIASNSPDNAPLLAELKHLLNKYVYKIYIDKFIRIIVSVHFSLFNIQHRVS